MVASLRFHRTTDMYKRMYRAVSARKAIIFAIGVSYPMTMIASYWYSVKGNPSSKPFNFHPPSTHSKLDNSEYQALPSAIQSNRENIIKEEINFYSAKPTRYTERIYDENVEFEDPFTYSKGIKTMNCIIHGIPNICTKAQMDNLEIEHYDKAISMKFDYTFEMGPYATLEMPILVYLTLDENNGKIIHHQDMWKGRHFFQFLGIERPPKYVNGLIARTVFGVMTGRFIE